MTYIPKQTKLARERIEAKLELGLIQKLESYCEYLESDRDYVISQALEIAFRKDRGFADWLEQRSAAPVAESAQKASPQEVRERKPRATPRVDQGQSAAGIAEVLSRGTSIDS